MADGSSGGESKLRLRDVFRALRYRNYRLFFLGQGLSLIGTWIQAVAMSWLVYRLTGSALLLGVVGFASQFATFLLSPFAGVFVDRWNKHRIVIITQSLFLVQAMALSFLVLTGRIQVWQIIGLAVFAGVVNGLDMPARQAFVVEMVENREDLSNAIALNSTMFNGARLIGPAIAGVLIAAVGEGWCFFLNGVSYIAVIIALVAMRVTYAAAEGVPPRAWHQLKEGFRYTFGFAPIRSLILLLGLVSLVAMPYSVLMPVFVTKVFHRGPSTLGLLTAANGVGALIGATWLASRKSVLGLGKWVPLAAAILGVGLIAFGLSDVLWFSLIALVVVGFAFITQMASSNTILQTIVDDEVRGRVMSFYTMAFIGMAPIGSLLGGVLADRIGAPHTVVIGGIACIIGAAAFGLKLPEMRRLVRPIYCKKGIVPAVVCGVQAISETDVPPEQW